MSKIILFDVDETLEVSRGPIKIAEIVKLKEAGHVVGICGNWGVGTRTIQGWHHLFSIIGPIEITKDAMLRQIMTYCGPGYEEYILVGNILGVSGASDDQGAAQRAGWRFIKESDFKIEELI